MYLDPRHIAGYIAEVHRNGIVDIELRRVRDSMVMATQASPVDIVIIAHLNQVFKALLTEKARQERIQQVGNDNRGTSENSSPGPTYHTP